MYYNRYTRCRGTAGRDVFPPYHRRVKRALCWCARPPVGTLTRGCISRRFSPDRDRVSEDSPLRAASDQTALQNDRHRVRATLRLCVLRPRPPIFEGGRARVEDSRCPTPLLSFPGRIKLPTLAGESSATSLLPHRIPFPRRAQRTPRPTEGDSHLPPIRTARSPPTLVLARRVDRRLCSSHTAPRTRNATTSPLHDQSRPGRTHCLGGFGIPSFGRLRLVDSPVILANHKRLPTTTTETGAGCTGGTAPFPRNASRSPRLLRAFPSKNMRYFPPVFVCRFGATERPRSFPLEWDTHRL